jgi:hypothetical protein
MIAGGSFLAARVCQKGSTMSNRQFFERITALAIGAGLALAVGLGAPALTQDTTKRVNFAAGAHSASLSGQVKGYDTSIYLLGATAGQHMTIDMTTSNNGAYFNVTAPGADSALFIGSTEGGEFDGVLPVSGDYRVDVYMMRNAARRGEVAEYTISFKITDSVEAPAPDFADGMDGGPDYWKVAGVSAGDLLNLRAGPSTANKVLARLANGTALRNLGCKMSGGQRWCKVEAPDATGWVAGSFLREGPAP